MWSPVSRITLLRGKAFFETARTFGGKTEFVLSSSGHIQSLINPLGNPKAKFLLNSDLPERAEDWLVAGREVSGSWWEHWRAWLAAHSGEMRAAPQSLGNERYKPGAKAPGTYVTEP
jgi:polyhydroxyalkanoate synthase subunit PhaC